MSAVPRPVFGLREYGAMLDATENLTDAAAALEPCPTLPAPPVYPAVCPFCHGTGGGQWNDCAGCDGNGVI